MNSLNSVSKLTVLTPILKIWARANSVAHDLDLENRKDFKSSVKLVYPEYGNHKKI